MNAGSALMTVLKTRDEDKYCLASKFDAINQNIEDFIDYSTITIASRRLGWPAASQNSTDI